VAKVQKIISNIIFTIFCIIIFVRGLEGFLALANRHEPMTERITGLVMGIFLCGGAMAMFFLIIMD